MKTAGKILLMLTAGLLLLSVLGPFLVPVPPPENTRPAVELAGPDSRFVELDGFQVHYKEAANTGPAAGQPALMLLHGFAASEFSWREVREPLAKLAGGTRVIAYDRPAFGLTERPLDWQGANPYATTTQASQVVRLMDALGIETAVLVGNSAGGTVAALAALEHPERIEALVLVDPAIYTGGGTPAAIRPLLHTPQADRLGPLFVRRIQDWGLDFARSAWHDPSKITDEIWAGYTRPLQVENWDRGLWELVKASGSAGVAERLDELTLPILVVTGDDDRIVPTEDSVRLAGELPNAELAVIPNCGHVPHEECPQAFLEAVESFLQNLPGIQ